ncbi:hypothetical protein CEP52_006617 [Fusarium oligoseptatum]|uniref:ABC transporter n=1 Tax=Fusarium oligoseptatum TaxID=2604345 RepID=A0A428TS69_9HYPO|nr:hypothetical protein CEP52_006617 [Fusarium oligoseptatum]
MMLILRISQALHFSCAIVAVVFVSAITVVNLGATEDRRHKRRDVSRRNHVPYILLILSYITEGVFTIFQRDESALKEARTLHLVVLIFTWTFIWAQQKTSRHLVLGASLLTLAFETPLLILAALYDKKRTYFLFQISCQAVRLLLLLFLAVDQLYRRRTETHNSARMEEETPFLQAQSAGGTLGAPSYGTEASIATSVSSDDDEDTITEASDSDDDTASIKRRRAKRLKETGGWWGYLSDFSILVPFFIPKKDRKVQFAILVCFICIAANRIFNVLIPRQLGIAADELLEHKNPFRALFIWFILSLLSVEGLVGLMEELAKIPIKQDSAEVMKAIEQGESLTNFLEVLIIDLFPTFVDVAIAFGLLYWKFNIYVSLAMATAIAAYITVEVITSNWNISNRRKSSHTQREEARVMHQAVQGWQTVTYFNMLGFERRRFGQAVENKLAASRVWGKMDAYTEMVLNMMIPSTFFVLASLVIYDISQGRSTPGDFVFLVQYWEYMIWPIRLISHNYRSLVSDMVDAERLLYLLRTKPSVVDKEGATDLVNIQGHVAFDHVDFHYDERKPTIRDLSFSVAPGQTVAFVGETGAGKSSIMKLLLRFYDVKDGAITIDGHDIRDITLSSLRNALGVVPQDPLLFNASILENLRYARPTATDKEIHEACRAAAIHDKILSFADGYNTQVGEQGVKLSGGEIQRLAIARVFLKDPPILILDEATSAVDTNTESSIQGALDTLRRSRSTFVIAHRLSTVVNADQILVIHAGEIVESGTHTELISRGGRYKELWDKQAGKTLVLE